MHGEELSQEKKREEEALILFRGKLLICREIITGKQVELYQYNVPCNAKTTTQDGVKGCEYYALFIDRKLYEYRIARENLHEIIKFVNYLMPYHCEEVLEIEQVEGFL